MRCEYVDRRGRQCETAWCPSHRLVIDGEVLCRRHAGTRNALAAPASGDTPPAPDLEVRSPGLVMWVSTGVDSAVRTLLGAPQQDVSVSEVTLVLVPGGATRSWERRWSSSTHVVCLRVDEGAPDELAVLVDGTETARLVPPWIADRRNADDAARQRYSGSVLGAVKAGIVASPR